MVKIRTFFANAARRIGWGIFTGLVQAGVRSIVDFFGWPALIVAIVVAGGGSVVAFFSDLSTEWVLFATALALLIFVPVTMWASANLKRADAELLHAAGHKQKLDQAEMGLRGPKAEQQIGETTDEITKEYPSKELLEFTAFGTILKVSAEHLYGSSGETRYALCFHWGRDEKTVFDEIDGHHPLLFKEDFNGDGLPEIAVRYHCGAHTRVLRVYQLTDRHSAPKLIPGADIGSDWPEIGWKARENSKGFTIYVKNRNWSGVPSQEFIEEQYVFEKNECVKVSK